MGPPILLPPISAPQVTRLRATRPHRIESGMWVRQTSFASFFIVKRKEANSLFCFLGKMRPIFFGKAAWINHVGVGMLGTFGVVSRRRFAMRREEKTEEKLTTAHSAILSSRFVMSQQAAI